MHPLGIRRSFVLGTASKEEAASKALDIYLWLVAKGWDATLSEAGMIVNAPAVSGGGEPAVGRFLAEVARTSSMKLVNDNYLLPAGEFQLSLHNLFLRLITPFYRSLGDLVSALHEEPLRRVHEGEIQLAL